MTTTSSRRAILAGAATMPALAIPAGTLATRFSFDPVFAAIENHRVKKARISTLAAVADNDLPDEIADVLYHEEWTALNELATTPTTLQGCAAASRYIEVYTKACQQGGLFSDFGETGDLGCNFLSRVASVLEARAAQS